MVTFTFHYVSILITGATFLCQLLCTFTFHYVSILMISSVYGYVDRTYVYIPLCLYFNWIWPVLSRWHMVVYIPLCLYFNSATEEFRSAYIFKFTFHYVSILICSRCCWSCFSVPFTFHYVSILIQFPGSCTDLSHVYIPLCLYFNKISVLAERRILSVYIPLCLYFNSGCPFSRLSFEHVYIPLCLYFNRWNFWKSQDFVKVYIPLCLYFNSSRTS